MKNALINQVGMLGDMFLWLVANLKQGVIYFIKQALPPNISAGSVYELYQLLLYGDTFVSLLAGLTGAENKCTVYVAVLKRHGP